MPDIQLDFGAITLDNSVLKSLGYKFHEGLLAELAQFRNSPVQIIQTDIVHNEAVKHLANEISTARCHIEKGLKAAEKHLKVGETKVVNARQLLSVDGSDEEIVEARLEKFYKLTGAHKIDSAEHVDLSALMEMYFRTQPPFETAKEKKYEFPDAIALLSLLSWAEKNDVNVIAVSSDKGWQDFAEGTERITIVHSLAEALAKFQPHGKVSDIIAHIREDSLLEQGNHVLNEIEDAIVTNLEDADIQVDAVSSMYYEYSDVAASLVTYELDDDEEGLVNILVVRIDDGSIVLRLGATVEAEVEASFSFSVRDSIDRDYVNMGGNAYTATKHFHTDILVTLSGDFSKDFDDIEVTDIKVLETLTDVDFGEVEPDWMNAPDSGLW